MKESKIHDKEKIQEILSEITNLKTYCNNLGTNTRGPSLEGYINRLSKNITLLNNEVEKVYDNSFKSTD